MKVTNFKWRSVNLAVTQCLQLLHTSPTHHFLTMRRLVTALLCQPFSCAALGHGSFWRLWATPLSRKMAQVTVNEGILEGAFNQNEFGGSYYSFKGIPYAEPPLRNLRFKAPHPPKPWKGVRRAIEFGPKCYQVNTLFHQTKGSGSEDCLYLNVFTPNLKPSKSLPVMVSIHGGGFFSGTGDDSRYGPDFLIRHDVVLVTFNYRVDTLGFLCLDIEDVPGNAGLKDQVAVLRWVKNNISNFGGNPENVTIFGVSSGGASVSFHLVSPMSKGLFRRAIAQSGSSTNHWPLIHEPRERALALTRKLSFTSTDPYKMYEYLKCLPVESIVGLHVPLTCDEQMLSPISAQFAVVSEKRFGRNETFFTGNVFDALRMGIHENVEVMSGFTEHEGIFGILLRSSTDSNFFKYADLLELFCPTQLRYNVTKKQKLEIGRQMRNYYIKDDLVTKDKILDIVRYFSFDDFTFDAIRWQKFVAKYSKNKCYLYKFTSKSDLNVLTDVFKQRELVGPGDFFIHAEDTMYLFSAKEFKLKVNQNSKEFKIIETVTKLWTNFAKYGNPTPDDSLGARWAPYSVKKQEYMDIGEQLILRAEPERNDFRFWETIFKKYLPEHLP